MPSTARASTGSSAKGSSSLPTWRFTKVMNMSDLSRDDDFLSHLLVEKLGTGRIPLLVHKMDPSRKFPKTDAGELLQIVRRLVIAKGQQSTVIRDAVDDLLMLPAIRYYLRSYVQKQINAFATHASRYLELYLPTGSIEIAHTSRYAHRTGKSELCILAARPLTPGSVIVELKGSMADLTEEEDQELKRANTTGISGIRRDFSVIHSKQLKKNHLFLGPARFVNHDCDNNVELFREGRYITFRVIKSIGVGEEVTAHYGDDYFGRRNRHCLCQSCEQACRGGYAAEDTLQPGSGSDSDSEGSEHSLSSSSDTEKDTEPLNVNERRTRRGVYAVMPEDKKERENSSAKIELDMEEDSSLLSISRSPSSAIPLGLSTPNSVMPSRASSISSSLTSLSADTDQISTKVPKRVVPIKPSTRMHPAIANLQQLLERSEETVQGPACQLLTPPLSTDTATVTSSFRSSARLQARVSVQPDAGGRSSRTATPSKDISESPAPQGMDHKKLNKSEAEARVLRPRPFPQSTSEFISGGKMAKGEGSFKSAKNSKFMDNNLPTCSTCNDILPVISVDSEIVWGLQWLDEKGKGKGKHKQAEKHECPRCMRHYAIYNVPWPNRIPTNGGVAFVPTPRHESSTPVEMTTSSRHIAKPTAANDRPVALSASLSSTVKSKSKQDEAEDERPSKKRKLDPVPREKPQTYARSRAILGVGRSRAGRMRRKVQDSVLTKHTPVDELKNRAQDETVLDVDNTTAQSQRTQPKFSFRAGASMQKMIKRSRAERATARTRIKARLETEAKEQGNQDDQNAVTGDIIEDDDKDDISKKRFRDNETDETQERPYIRLRPTESDDEVPPRRLSMMGMQRLRHNGASNLLSHAPNPLLFARRKWFATLLESEPELVPGDNYPPWQGSTDESDGPVTPEDDNRAISLESDEERRDTSLHHVPRAKPFVGRGMKPSPVNFAIKRWSSLSNEPKPGSATTIDPDSLLKASTPPSVDSDLTNDLSYADLPGQDEESSLHSPKLDNPSAYRPSRIWQQDIVGHSHNTPPGSPDSSRFVLRHKASFGSSPAIESTTDDSDNVVEQLISEDLPLTDVVDADERHNATQFEKVMTILGDAMQCLIDGSYPDRIKESSASMSCKSISLPTPLRKEGCRSEAAPSAVFVTPSPPSSRLIKAGWDTDTEP